MLNIIDFGIALQLQRHEVLRELILKMLNNLFRLSPLPINYYQAHWRICHLNKQVE